MQGETKMKRQIDTPTPDEDLMIVKSRLHWQLMGDRRKAISAVDSCIRGLVDLRAVLGRDAVDPLVRDYRSVLRFLVSIGTNAMPSPDQLADYQKRMSDLQQRLADLKEPLECSRESSHMPVGRHRGTASRPLPIFTGK
jgi:hypothetical protein